eukprot:1390251-Rhodomonas_salina.1
MYVGFSVWYGEEAHQVGKPSIRVWSTGWSAIRGPSVENSHPCCSRQLCSSKHPNPHFSSPRRAAARSAQRVSPGVTVSGHRVGHGTCQYRTSRREHERSVPDSA